jgi:hypothetical protein
VPARWRTQTTHLEALEVEACWRPMEGDVAGDFHDVIDLRDGRVVAVIGDVAGFGSVAAERADDLLGALRRAFRHRDDPIDVLRVLDVWTLTRPDELFATLALAVVDVAEGAVEVTRAGHPPIALREPGRARFVEGLPDPPLGLAGERRAVSYALGGEATLFLYTDGLVERRGRVLDEGLDRLLEVAAALPAGGASAIALARRTTELLGPPADDATIISLRLAATMSPAGTVAPAGEASGRPLQVRLRAYLDPADLRSARTEQVVRELARRVADRLEVAVEVVDTTSGDSRLDAEGVVAAPMVVRVSPPPVVRVVGALRTVEELARAVHLPLEEEGVST